MRWKNSDPDSAWSTRRLTLINILQGYQCRYYSNFEIAVSLITRFLEKVECLSTLFVVWTHDRLCSAIHSSQLDSISLGRTGAWYSVMFFCGPSREIYESMVPLNQFPPSMEEQQEISEIVVLIGAFIPRQRKLIVFSVIRLIQSLGRHPGAVSHCRRLNSFELLINTLFHLKNRRA
jgi:hypothetical protein